MILGIDASNIRAGGGVTHLVELLRAADPALAGFEKVVVWACRATLDKIDDRKWLDKESDSLLENNILCRTYWQRFRLKALATKLHCDVLFVPGGNDVAGYQPTTTMSQNMLPFEWKEMLRFGFSFSTLRFLLLRLSQGRSFSRSSGVIFLTRYAEDGIEKIIGRSCNLRTVIPHGLHRRFFQTPRQQRTPQEFNESNPCRVVYVSIVHIYKHQWNVVEAISLLRKQGIHVVLDLIGPPGSGSELLACSIQKHDPEGEFVSYRGEVPYGELDKIYTDADIGVFASSCENLPNILLESMAAGLPIACSNMGPMPEVLGDAGLYFAPERPDEIADAVRMLIGSSQLRERLASGAYEKALDYTWERCSMETFGFLAKVAIEGCTR